MTFIALFRLEVNSFLENICNLVMITFVVNSNTHQRVLLHKVTNLSNQG